MAQPTFAAWRRAAACSGLRARGAASQPPAARSSAAAFASALAVLRAGNHHRTLRQRDPAALRAGVHGRLLVRCLGTCAAAATAAATAAAAAAGPGPRPGQALRHAAGAAGACYQRRPGRWRVAAAVWRQVSLAQHNASLPTPNNVAYGRFFGVQPRHGTLKRARDSDRVLQGALQSEISLTARHVVWSYAASGNDALVYVVPGVSAAAALLGMCTCQQI